MSCFGTHGFLLAWALRPCHFEALTGLRHIWRQASILLLAFCLIIPAQGLAKDALAVLVLEDSKGKVLLSHTLPENQFALRYTHSVALTPVTDYFHVRMPDIVLDKTEYQDFGAGLPHTPGPGQVMTAENGKVSISGYNAAFRHFDLRVGRVAGHVLVIPSGAESQEIPLDSIARPGSAIRFSVHSVGQADFDHDD